MDIASFYGFFSATCFTLLGLWWNVVQGHPGWMREEGLRRAVGGVYLAFFLPALMGLFVQVGGSSSPGFWRMDLALLAIFAAAAGMVNAFAMTPPVYSLEVWLADALNTKSEALVLGLVFGVGVILLPLGLAYAAAAPSRTSPAGPGAAARRRASRHARPG